MTEEQFKRLKQEVEQARADADRAQGALEQLMGRLKSEFDCESLRDAKEHLADLQESKKKTEKELTKALDAYQKKWKA